MKQPLHQRLIQTALAAVLMYPGLKAQQTKLDWLEDQPGSSFTNILTTPLSGLNVYPKLNSGVLNSAAVMNAQELACFDVVISKAITNSINAIAGSQALNANQMYLRYICAQEYQGWNDANYASGILFGNTGPVTTTTGEVFAGHFLYKAGTTSTLAIAADSGDDFVIHVSDASIISSNQYAVVYDPPFGSFANAEHVFVKSRNTSNPSDNTITVTRAIRSTGSAKVSGAIIATHQTGNGTTPENWAWNFTRKCPRDGANKTYAELISTWIANNYDRDAMGNPVSARSPSLTCHGWMNDSDFEEFIMGGSVSTRNCDADNNGVTDWMMSGNGDNWCREGWEDIFNGIRSALNLRGGVHLNAILLGGGAQILGMDVLNGTDYESFPEGTAPGEKPDVSDYTRLPQYMLAPNIMTGLSLYGPHLGFGHYKGDTKLYYKTTPHTTNAPYRLGMALSCCYGLYCAYKIPGATSLPDADGSFVWWDEYAADTAIASPDYGKAITKTDPAALYNTRHWLGEALGPYYRVYNPDLFAASNNLFPNGTFEDPISGWYSGTALVERISSTKYQGSYSLHIDPAGQGNLVTDEIVTGPSVSLTGGNEYTLCFAVKIPAVGRRFKIGLGNNTSNRLIAANTRGGWQKVIWTFRASVSENAQLQFEVGGETDEFWVDQLYLFSGSANILRRDFQNGCVIANGSYGTVTLPLGATYRKILGTQDPGINDGSVVTSITVPPFDGIFLIKSKNPNSNNEIKIIESSVYPNPFSGCFMIDAPEGSNNLEIYNNTGIKMYTQSITNYRNLKVEFLAGKPSGIYFLRITGHGIAELIKLVKI